MRNENNALYYNYVIILLCEPCTIKCQWATIMKDYKMLYYMKWLLLNSIM